MVTLQFSMRFVNVPFFLERYFRVFNLDGKDLRSQQMATMARGFSRFAMRQGHLLDYKPSSIAATCLLLAINISYSDVAPQLGYNKF